MGLLVVVPLAGQRPCGGEGVSHRPGRDGYRDPLGRLTGGTYRGHWGLNRPQDHGDYQHLGHLDHLAASDGSCLTLCSAVDDFVTASRPHVVKMAGIRQLPPGQTA